MRKLIEGVIDDIGEMSSLDGVCSKTAGWVTRATKGDFVKNALSGTWLGHPLHPVLSDLPVGAWAMASALDVTAGRGGAKAARRLVGLGLLSAVPTAAAGWSDWADTYGPPQRVGYAHALGNAAGVALQAASWVARARGRRGAGVMLSGVGLGVTVCAAYLGGHLSFVRGIGVNHTAFQEPATKWTDVASLSVLSEDKLVRVTVEGVPVVLVRHDGQVYALSATCTHAGGPLDEGKIVGDGCIECPWHGSVFRLADGEAVRGPASVDEPPWDVKIDSGRVLVRPATSS
ncbi:Rieske 2Fe-2S domain-containing protein [Streptomyces sp. NBC_00820]|uniref:Rieske 2Fe-2S domain-containing protein n=1 Tax=Streptomyces sp. NBC_00820 TaxID=2975842 RepID=UPI002ED48B37|nr:Rieske 2Fe-2S domain-containing protein [Streptomyces sp. NBC_00820]